MATRGFEFVGSRTASGGTPVIRDFILGAAADHLIGDLVLMQSDGYVDQVTGTTTEVTAVVMEYIASADVTAGTTTCKCAVIDRDQIWRCSADASTTTAVEAYTKTCDTADANTIDADDITNGAMIYYGNEGTDSDGNLVMQVVFADTSFGNA